MRKDIQFNRTKAYNLPGLLIYFWTIQIICKCKAAIYANFGLAEFSVDPQSRALYHFIAKGVQLESNWYQDLMETETELLQEEEFKINLQDL